MYRRNHASLVHHQHLLYKQVTWKAKQKNWKGSWWVLIMWALKDSSEGKKPPAHVGNELRRCIALCQDTLLKKGSGLTWMSFWAAHTEPGISSLYRVPIGTCCLSVWHFHVQNHNDPTTRLHSLCTLGFDLVSTDSVSEELPEEVCSQAVLLQPPIHQPTAFPLGQIFFRSHQPQQSQTTAFFNVSVLLTLIIAVLHLQHNVTFYAYRAALLGEYSCFESFAYAPDLCLGEKACL